MMGCQQNTRELTTPSARAHRGPMAAAPDFQRSALSGKKRVGPVASAAANSRLIMAWIFADMAFDPRLS